MNNPNSTVATLTAPLTDTLPSGVVTNGSGSTTCGGTVTTGTSTVTLTGGSIPANGSCTVTVNVTAPSAGSYENKLPAGALQTNKGNNAAQASAILTVKPAASVAPKLTKAFSPATINAGGVSTLTITLSNTNATKATLTAPLTDTLPSGVVVVAGSASTTCGGTVTVNKGGEGDLDGGIDPGQWLLYGDGESHRKKQGQLHQQAACRRVADQ
ncbi:MAG: hypothetical protein M3461_02005 [Pseudomonadota bacterium]|nr:hypothetical protein [Pseudomonadota bacterium]